MLLNGLYRVYIKYKYIKPMITQKGDFKRGIINSLLFSSMLSSTELYLSNPKAVKGSKKESVLTRTKGSIENLLISNSKQEADSKTIESELFSGSPDLNKDYISKSTSTFTKSVKSLYASFVNYGKKAYEAIERSSKKVDGFVKLTIQKIIKVGEYIMTLTSGQWNKVTGSPEDLDTNAPTVSQKDSVSAEDAKYAIGYQLYGT
jgi:hypothetical protein|tara:strand:+ start:1087 stop:1698 length:612 start_codon:yes stop_codon:yes gene_type:complete